MSFQVPEFNSLCNLYTSGGVVARALNVPCNLAIGRRVAFPALGGGSDFTLFPAYMQLLLPAGTDIRGAAHAGGSDNVTIVGRIGMLYTVTFADTVAYGFPNEYRIALLTQAGPLPVPFTY